MLNAFWEWLHCYCLHCTNEEAKPRETVLWPDQGPIARSEWSRDHFIPVQIQAFIFHDCSCSRLVLLGHGTPSPDPCPGGAMVCVFSVTGKLLTF